MIAAGPTALWYATRSSGFVSLLLLTAILTLGIATARRWGTRGWPRFVSQALHRNLSLLVLVFLLLHIATTVLDPFAGISVLNAAAPFTGSYRPIWLGLGVVSVELLAALVVTSLLRDRIGFRLWRVIHWAAYACWPAAVLHTLGTGSDIRSVWAIGLTLLCVGTVFTALAWRLLDRAARVPRVARVVGTLVSVAATLAVLGFAAAGPLQSGWARAAGTPPQLLASGARTTEATPAAPPTALPLNLSDDLSGTVQQRRGALEVDLRDTRDAGLVLTLLLDSTQTAGTVTAAEGTVRLCQGTVTVTTDVRGTCGGTAVVVTLTQLPDGSVSGHLTTSAAGG